MNRLNVYVFNSVFHNPALLYSRSGCYNDTRNHMHVDPEVVRYSCAHSEPFPVSNTTWHTNSTYNEGNHIHCEIIFIR